eukprot:6227395-Pyramimonas_sp.AAC.1
MGLYLLAGDRRAPRARIDVFRENGLMIPGTRVEERISVIETHLHLIKFSNDTVHTACTAPSYHVVFANSSVATSNDLACTCNEISHEIYARF